MMGELAFADFVTGTYRLGGAPSTVGGLFQQIDFQNGFFNWNPATDIIPGVGFVNNTAPLRGPCASVALLALLAKGWTTVMTYDVTAGSGPTQPALYHVVPANLEYTPEWEYDHSAFFDREWALDFHPNLTTAQTTYGPSGSQLTAVRFHQSGLAYSTNGRAVQQTAAVPDITPFLVGLGIGLHLLPGWEANGASITLKSVKFMPLVPVEYLATVFVRELLIAGAS